MDRPDAQLDKATLRRQVRRRRSDQYGETPAGRAARADVALRLGRIGAGLVRATVPPGGTVTSYRSWRAEPPTGPLNDTLIDHGFTVLVPHTLPDLELDWLDYAGVRHEEVGDPLRRVAPAQPEESEESAAGRLGLDAIGRADLVLIPGLAVDPDGHRLGQGGGCYDRALTRMDPAAKIVVILYDDDRVEQVPVEAHDRRVDGVLTPSGVSWFWRR